MNLKCMHNVSNQHLSDHLSELVKNHVEKYKEKFFVLQ